MKKILLTIGYFILVIISSIMIVRYSYNAYLIYQYNQQNYNVSMMPLAMFNFGESYIVHYNQGNIYYRQGNYEDAIRAYKMALALRMSKKKECDVRVNLALAMLGTIKDTYDDITHADETLTVLMKAREVLLEDGCAMDEGIGHDEEAQKLKEEIDKMIEDLKQKQGSSDNEEEPKDNNNDPNEQGSNSPQDQETEEEKEKKQREEMMKNDLQERMKQAAQERDSDLSYANGMDEGFNFLNDEPIW